MALDIGKSDAVALNAKTKNTTLNVNMGNGDGSERRTENTVMALNAETKK